MNVKIEPAEDTVAILVVEDSRTQAEQLIHILERKPYRVMAAENGKQALVLLRECRPTLVITDIIMPEMNGYELCKRIKSEEETQEIPVILLTALTSSEDVLEGLACGADNFITKPYSEEYLLSSIEKILAGGKLRKSERVRIGVEISFAGKTRFITADQQQMLSLLISTYEAAVHRNTELVKAQDELRSLNERLEELVEKRTAALSAEIVERKRAEEREKHLNAVLRSIRDVNQLIVHEKERDRLIQGACDKMIASRGFQGAWIVLTDRSSTDMESACTGFEDTVFDSLAAMIREGRLPACCRRFRAEGGVVVTDASPAVVCEDCPLAHAHAGNAAMTMGLRHNDHLFGWMGVSVPAEFAADQEEASLLTEIAGDIAFALHNRGLELQRDRYAQIVAGSSEGMALVDRGYTYLETNQSYRRLVTGRDTGLAGRSVEDVLGREFFQGVVKPSLDRCLAGDEVRFATALEVSGAAPRFVDVLYTPCLADDGTVSAVAVCVRDITDRKRAEEALRESEERFRRLFEHAPLGYQSLDENGNLLEVNQAWLDLLGYRREEAIGRWFGEFLNPADREQFLQNFTRFKKTGVAHDIQYAMPHKDGSLSTISIEGRVVFDPQGNCLQTHCILTDITERRRAEEERDKLQAQLQQAQKMESVGRLAGGVAHDYNNMLGVIIGYGELALEKVDSSEPLHDDLVEILNAAKRSAEITRQLLAFARKQIIAPKVLDLNEAVESMLKMLRRLIGEDIDLAWLPETTLWPVHMDPAQVDQILANLCVNARDAIAGVGKVTIETDKATFDEAYCAEHPGFDPGEYVLLAVSDDGCGMDKETLGSIFEPFFTTKDVDQGTGLGLSTVYGIVRQNNGFINVYSEPGKGTTFKIYLPRYEGEAGEKPEERAAEIPMGRGETVLVVEDEEAIRKLAVKMLEKLGYTVLSAGAVREAVALAESHAGPIHLLMTDVVMPEMNGRDLADQLRGIYPDIKALFMSGYTADVIAHRGVLEDGVNFIQKPFPMTDLAFKVRAALDQK